MSYLIRKWVWDQKISPTQKLVLDCLAFNRGNNPTAYPALAKIIEQTGFARRTVIYALEALVKAGLIIPQKRSGETTEYTFECDTNIVQFPGKNRQMH
jgi:Fe2+ or Zn2+ uptake regulation protein